MIWITALAVLPWLAVGLLVAFGINEPADLGSESAFSDAASPSSPSVRVIVPARDEARSIEACVRSLSDQDYPDFKIVVVDDRSSDGTAELVRALPTGRARSMEVVSGAPLPLGWFGKPWACAQGAHAAEEELLLFTDADTVHAPSLLRRAVSALHQDDAAAVSLLGRQELGSFGERLVQPHIFTMLGLRFRRLDQTLEAGQQDEAMANGQYILVRRAAYESVGGHDAVRSEVVEDLCLAQNLTAAGHRLSLKSAKDAFSTRMYQSLGEVVNGWTKNLATGARQSGGWLGRTALLAIVVYAVGAWLLPPTVLASLVGLRGLTDSEISGALLAWSGGASLTGLVAWAEGYRRFEVSPAYAFLYPAGALVVAIIAVRSGWRGSRRVEWKGRRYSSGGLQGESG